MSNASDQDGGRFAPVCPAAGVLTKRQPDTTVWTTSSFMDCRRLSLYDKKKRQLPGWQARGWGLPTTKQQVCHRHTTPASNHQHAVHQLATVLTGLRLRRPGRLLHPLIAAAAAAPLPRPAACLQLQQARHQQQQRPPAAGQGAARRPQRTPPHPLSAAQQQQRTAVTFVSW